MKKGKRMQATAEERHISGRATLFLPLVPLDKYVKLSQKTNLRARRRNTTADKLLQSHLKHLESGHHKEVRQYLRNKIRIESELRDLETIPSERGSQNGFSPSFYASSSLQDRSQSAITMTSYPPTSSYTRSYKAKDPLEMIGDTYTRQTDSSLFSGRNPSDYSRSRHSFRRGSSETDDSLPRTASSNVDEADHSNRNYHVDVNFSGSFVRTEQTGSNLNEERNIHKNGKDKSRGAHDFSRPNTQPASASRFRRANIFTSGSYRQHHSQSPCRYSPDGNMFHSCNHFPCITPATYHTLGLRRDDLSPRASHESLVDSDDDKETPLIIQARSASHSRNTSSGDGSNRPVTYSNKHDLTAPFHRSEDTKAVIPIWDKRNQPKKFKFKPIEGPAFSPKPVDPILEHVRSGSSKPTIPPINFPARVSVEGRMRGLKQLIVEMRERHEKQKPSDWATNYGQRLPMRMLQNPVVPL